MKSRNVLVLSWETQSDFYYFVPFQMYGFLFSFLWPHGYKVAATAACMASTHLCEKWPRVQGFLIKLEKSP